MLSFTVMLQCFVMENPIIFLQLFDCSTSTQQLRQEETSNYCKHKQGPRHETKMPCLYIAL